MRGVSDPPGAFLVGGPRRGRVLRGVGQPRGIFGDLPSGGFSGGALCLPRRILFLVGGPRWGRFCGALGSPGGFLAIRPMVVFLVGRSACPGGFFFWWWTGAVLLKGLSFLPGRPRRGSFLRLRPQAFFTPSGHRWREVRRPGSALRPPPRNPPQHFLCEEILGTPGIPVPCKARRGCAGTPSPGRKGLRTSTPGNAPPPAHPT